MRRKRILLSFLIIIGIMFSGCTVINKTIGYDKKKEKVETSDVDEVEKIEEYSTNEADDETAETAETTEEAVDGGEETTIVKIVNEGECTTKKATSQKLPSDILEVVNMYEETYPNMRIGVGIYSLDGCKGYEYKAQDLYNGACTIKAPYACFVLVNAEERGIDIYSKTIEYQSRHQIGGSGVIQYSELGTEYTIGYLLSVLLSESDNDAYMMLLDEFPLGDFYQYNSSIGGQCDWSQWGRATVIQRKNEWLNIWRYITSNSTYSEDLRQMLTGTQYAYLCYYSAYWHSYLHKSGWTEDSTYYPAAADCMIVDDSYLIIVMTEDTTIGSGRIDAISSVGRAVEDYIGNYGSLF